MSGIRQNMKVKDIRHDRLYTTQDNAMRGQVNTTIGGISEPKEGTLSAYNN
jgi:hypothetical protein